MIIGLSGIKGNGKDTVADYLVSKYHFQKLSFAYYLKKILKILFKFNEEQLNGKLKQVKDEKWNITPRECMEFFGTTIFRQHIQQLISSIDDNFWIKLMEQSIKNCKNKNIVISDIRFENEAIFIKSIGGVIFNIIKPNKFINLPVSELQINLDKYINCSIKNTTTKKNLYESIEILMYLYNFSFNK